MQWIMKICARGALGLGAAALLLAGVPAHAGPASGESVLAPAGETTRQEKGVKALGHGQAGGQVLTPGDASREGQPLRLVQAKTQPEAAEKLEQQRLKEQQEREKLRRQERQQQRQPDMKRMREPMPEAAPAAPAAIPPKPATSRFGAGVIRDKESADGD
jgi:hypothetical protein